MAVGALMRRIRLRTDQWLPHGRRRQPRHGRQGRAPQGRPSHRHLKEFTEQLILGAMMGIAFEAAGADVLDGPASRGSIGARGGRQVR
ncbi:hypothetical protein ACRAWF_10345 [Streptomyces sp. L7]